MSILEVLGEIFYPGKLPTDFKDKKKRKPQKFLGLRFLISFLSILIIEYFSIIFGRKYGEYYILIINAMFFIYLFLAYKTNIYPTLNNTGWIPFLIDNPFRFSDDINRIAIVVLIVLWPGKFITKSFIDFYNHQKR